MNIEKSGLAGVAAVALLVGAIGYGLGHHQGRSAGTSAVAAREHYQCPMHPQIVTDKPGHCPICGMKLQKVDVNQEAAGGSGQRRVLYYRNPMRPEVTSQVPAKDEMGMDYIPVYTDEGTSGAVIDGHAGFSLPLERQQLIGVKTAKAEVRALDVEIRAVGHVAYDPELYNAIEEYKQAAIARDKLKDSPLQEAKDGASATVRSAATRLRLLGLSQDQIDKMMSGGPDPINLLLPGKTAWIYADVYENEVDLIRPGQEMAVTATSLPGRVYRGKVVAVDSVVNSETRTARVRGLIETPEEALRPDAFVNVKIEIALGRRLAVPEDAVLDTGEHQIVFVKKGQGEFEPREVKLGRQTKEYYEVLSGMSAGEDVVTSANFLIDSESRFRAALSSFGGALKPGAKPARATP